MLVSHPKLHRAFLRGVRFSDEDGVFVIQLGRFRGQIEVADTPFWVVAYDPQSGEIQLTDGSVEPACGETLTWDPDGVLRIQVKGRFAARFTQTGQAHLLDAVEEREGSLALRAGERWLPLGGLGGA